MAKRRGRPSQTALQQTLKRDGRKIAKEFRRYPLRQPVDPLFKPFYQRILTGDLAAVKEYCESSFSFDASFYELIGRLVTLEDVAAAKQIVSYFSRQYVHLTSLPDNKDEVYGYWYFWLALLSRMARQFIRERYKVDDSMKRGQLWEEYINKCYMPAHGYSNEKTQTTRPQDIKELKAWGEQFCADRYWLRDLVARFRSHGLVPRPIFDELAESGKRADASAEIDKRKRTRPSRWTPSSIARKYACAIAGISPSTVSHKNRSS